MFVCKGLNWSIVALICVSELFSHATQAYFLELVISINTINLVVVVNLLVTSTHIMGYGMDGMVCSGNIMRR
jgi:hypothetical protein